MLSLPHLQQFWGKAAQEITLVLPSFCSRLWQVCLWRASGLPENCEAEKLRSCPCGSWIRVLAERRHSCAKTMQVAVWQCLGRNGFRASQTVQWASAVCSWQKQRRLYLPGNRQEQRPPAASAGSTSCYNGHSGSVRVCSSSRPSWIYILRRCQSEGKGQEVDRGWLHSASFTTKKHLGLHSLFPIAPDKQNVKWRRTFWLLGTVGGKKGYRLKKCEILFQIKVEAE